jgi:isoquinoline 1-oxidoreductase
MKAKSVSKDFPVVCIGGSAGGLDAYTRLLRHLTADMGVAIDLCPWDGGTNGSQTTRSFSPHMRVAAAEAKTILMQLGSDYLQAPLSQLEVKDGIISDIKNNKSKVSYGELTKGKRIEKHLDDKPELKDYTEFKYVEEPYLHQDSRLKVTGEAKFSADIQLPGLLHAPLLRPPSHGAKLLTADVKENCTE